MADAYWRYSDGRQQQAAAAAAAAAAALPPLVAKRPRTEYDIPSGHALPSHYGHDNEMGVHRLIRDVDPAGAYERYLLSAQISSYGGAEPARSVSGGISAYPIEDPRVRVIGGSDPVPAKSRTVAVGGDRPEVSLPPDASNTLFVEGLPSNCKRREVSHIFRPFVGYKEVRLVTKESRHRGGEPLVLCFVDFVSPAHAATAKDALQGYLFDEHDRDSIKLKLQFARYPGARSGGGNRGKR